MQDSDGIDTATESIAPRGNDTLLPGMGPFISTNDRDPGILGKAIAGKEKGETAEERLDTYASKLVSAIGSCKPW